MLSHFEDSTGFDKPHFGYARARFLVGIAIVCYVYLICKNASCGLRLPMAVCRWPLADGRLQMAACRWPRLCPRLPTACRWPLADGRLQVPSWLSPIAGPHLRGFACRRAIAGPRWPMADCQSSIASSYLRIAIYFALASHTLRFCIQLHSIHEPTLRLSQRQQLVSLEFPVGNGDVCDALECAVLAMNCRMVIGVVIGIERPLKGTCVVLENVFRKKHTDL